MALAGTVGNILTLLALPWARRKRILGFHKTPARHTNTAILNLAAADLLYCVTNLPLYSLTVGYTLYTLLLYLSLFQYFSRSWPFSWGSCVAFAAFRYFNAYAAWMSLGFVAFSR